jgi:hypothetical protein
MDMKDAVKSAKSYVAELFREDGIAELGLEEIEFDDDQEIWNITIGFTRLRDQTPNQLARLTGQLPENRTYRVVKIRDRDAKFISVKLRETVN